MTTARFAALALAFLASGCRTKAEPTVSPSGERILEMTVNEDGFAPAETLVKKGQPLLLKVTRTTDKTCATELLIEGTDINVPLPLGKQVEVRFTPSHAGTVRYGCAMGMMVSGVLSVD